MSNKLERKALAKSELHNSILTNINIASAELSSLFDEIKVIKEDLSNSAKNLLLVRDNIKEENKKEIQY